MVVVVVVVVVDKVGVVVPSTVARGGTDWTKAGVAVASESESTRMTGAAVSEPDVAVGGRRSSWLTRGTKVTGTTDVAGLPRGRFSTNVDKS